MNSHILFCKFVFFFYVLTCIVCTVDTDLFIYPSLSRTLLMEIGILLIAFCSLCYVAVNYKKNTFYGFSKMQFYIASWILFIILHTLILDVVEEYRTIYLCVTLFATYPLSYLQKVKLLSKKCIDEGLIVMVVIHLVYVFGQLFGVIESYNAYFSVTGCNDNPSVTAICLTGCMPLITYNIFTKKHRALFGIIFILTFIAIILLHCRTAYVGLVIELFVCILMIARRNKYCLSVILKYKFLIIFFVLLIAIPICMRTYNMKRDSSDSRWLIWQLSFEMIVERPMGYGYGLYEKYYNLKQEDYFRSGKGSKEEKRTASFCNMAYNDYLEQGVEGGVVGAFFFITFYIIFIVQSFKKHNVEVLCVVSGIAVMSLTNFVYSSIQVWWLIICYVSLVIPQFSAIDFRRKFYPIAILAMLIILILALSRIVQMTTSQIALKSHFNTLSNGGRIQDKDLRALKTNVGTSEAYWNICAYNSMLNNHLDNAIKYLDQVSVYTSSEQSYITHYILYLNIGREEKGILYIDTLSYIQPSLLRPKLILMEYYDKIGDTDKADYHAKEILATTPRVLNDKCRYIQSKAFEYIHTKSKRKK